jgi:glycosyltransferase involved in cell wall biosynthesis
MQSVDDIILLDGGSTDGTLEIAQGQQNCRAFPQDSRFLNEQGFIIDFSGMRNYGYSLAQHKWILCVDSDEEASDELLDEVREITTSNKIGVYYARRIFFWKGKPVITLSKSTFDQIRLFHLDAVRGCIKPVHEKLDIIPGVPRKHLSEVIHVPLENACALRPKYDRYLQIELDNEHSVSFGRWFRWFFIRNICIGTPRRMFITLLTRLIPVRGPRFPYAHEWEQWRYNWKLTWGLCPFMKKKR